MSDYRYYNVTYQYGTGGATMVSPRNARSEFEAIQMVMDEYKDSDFKIRIIEAKRG